MPSRRLDPRLSRRGALQHSLALALLALGAASAAWILWSAERSTPKMPNAPPDAPVPVAAHEREDLKVTPVLPAEKSRTAAPSGEGVGRVPDGLAEQTSSGEAVADAPGGASTSSPAVSTVPPRVALFEHGLDDIALGARWHLGEGLFSAPDDFPNDAVSSVEVSPGAALTAYEDDAGNGARVTLGPGRHELSSYAFDERTSSVRVTRLGAGSPDAPALAGTSVALYEHRSRAGDPRGRTWTLPVPATRTTALFTARSGAFDDDAVSAAWVPAGLELTLCDGPDGRGPALVLGPGFHELDLSGFSDRASSARVARVGE